MSGTAVIVVTYNMSGTLKDCVDSLLRQSVHDFRLIIIDDASSDGTENAVRNFSDKRINYKKNDFNSGIAASRNRGLAELNGEKIVFFLDADCYPRPDWLEEGIKSFMNDDTVVAAEGLTTYESGGYRPRLSEKFYHMNSKPGLCQTHNCAYKKEVFQQIGGFDDINFNWINEDTDFFYRAKKAFPDKKFLVCPKMQVVHRKSQWNISSFFKDAHKTKCFIKLIKKHGRLDFGAGKLGSFILSPGNFMLALFPLLIIMYIWKKKIRICNLYDLSFIFLYILKAYYYRFLVWRYSFKEKIFVI